MISSHDLQILSSTSLFAGFSEDALRALCAALRPSVAELPRGRVLWRMGEQVTQAGIVLSGRVEAWHYTAAGQADLAAVHGAGGVFGDVLMSAQTVGSPVELRTIRIPVHMVETINKVLRTSHSMVQSLGREPTTQEIAAELHMDVQKVEEILKIAQEPVSLETPIGEEDDSHLGDFIQDDDASQPAEEASYTLLREQLEEVLKTLTPREEEVLRMRFGLIDGKPHTLEEVGKKFDVTRERIIPRPA